MNLELGDGIGYLVQFVADVFEFERNQVLLLKLGIYAYVARVAI